MQDVVYDLWHGRRLRAIVGASLDLLLLTVSTLAA